LIASEDEKKHNEITKDFSLSKEKFKFLTHILKRVIKFSDSATDNLKIRQGVGVFTSNEGFSD